MEYKQYILSLFKNCDFNELTLMDYKEKILLNLPKSFKYTYDYGCSKLVIIPKDNPNRIVIKIPFTGEYIRFPHYEYHPFKENIINKEINIYKKAKKHNLQFLFAKNTSLNKNIYIQPYCIAFEEDECSYYNTHTTSAFSDSCNEQWQSIVCNYYGEQTLQELNDFIEDECIEDLHEANIGFLYEKNNKPIIFDYSGFNDISEE